MPYCGTPPDPGELIARFNLDPALIVALLALAAAHIRWRLREGSGAGLAAAGWAVTAAALVSPLCALSVALFSARVGQHMLLALVAAPLLALALPGAGGPRSLWAAAGAFLVALWAWHMPGPYAATFTSDAVYWLMHLTLTGSAVWLWRGLLHDRGLAGMAAGLLTSVQMGVLGAVLTLAGVPLFAEHLATASAWGLSPLADQALGGLIMWVPGMAFFIASAARSLHLLWRSPAEA